MALSASTALSDISNNLSEVMDEELAMLSAVRVNDGGSGNIISAYGRQYVLTNAHVLTQAGNILIFPEPNIDENSDLEWNYRGKANHERSRTFLLSDGFYTTIEDPEGGIAIGKYIGTLRNTGRFIDGEESTYYDLGILQVLDETHPAVSHIRTVFEQEIIPEEGRLSIFPEDYGLNRRAVPTDSAHVVIIPESGLYSLSGFPDSFGGQQLHISSEFQFGDHPDRQGELFMELEGARDGFRYGSSGSIAFSDGVPIAAHARVGRCNSLASPAYPALHFINEVIPELHEAGYNITVQMKPYSYDVPPSTWRFDLQELGSGRVLAPEETEQVLAELGISQNPVDQQTFTDEELQEFRQSHDICDITSPTPHVITRSR